MFGIFLLLCFIRAFLQELNQAIIIQNLTMR